jgi:hypothetical protein
MKNTFVMLLIVPFVKGLPLPHALQTITKKEAVFET